jgi:hypothetical protein
MYEDCESSGNARSGKITRGVALLLCFCIIIAVGAGFVLRYLGNQGMDTVFALCSAPESINLVNNKCLFVVSLSVDNIAMRGRLSGCLNFMLHICWGFYSFS